LNSQVEVSFHFAESDIESLMAVAAGDIALLLTVNIGKFIQKCRLVNDSLLVARPSNAVE